MKKGFTITYEYGENLYVNTTNRCNFNCEFCPLAAIIPKSSPMKSPMRI